MTRYFFNLEGPAATAPDLIGRDLPDSEAAKAEGARFASEFETPQEIEGLLAYDWVEVLDETQRLVARLPIGNATAEPNRTG